MASWTGRAFLWSLVDVPERNEMKRRGRVCAGILSSFFLLLTFPGVALHAQTSHPPSFLAEKYDVSAYIDTIAQGINAVAKVDFRAQEVSGTVRVERHENLDV